MAEYDFGLPPRNSDRSLGERAQSIWDWFITPDAEGGLIPPTVSVAVAEELEDLLKGRSELGGGATKGIQKGIEKVIRGGPLGEAIVEVLFGDNRAGAPDPSSGVDEQGRPRAINQKGQTAYAIDKDGNLVAVQMLPMWDADP